MMENAPTRKLRVTLKKSMIGRLQGHKDCVRGLGLRRIGHSVVVGDSECTRGMIQKVNYMVEWEEL